jgi:hypothetical protein
LTIRTGHHLTREGCGQGAQDGQHKHRPPRLVDGRFQRICRRRPSGLTVGNRLQNRHCQGPRAYDLGAICTLDEYSSSCEHLIAASEKHHERVRSEGGATKPK